MTKRKTPDYSYWLYDYSDSDFYGYNTLSEVETHIKDAIEYDSNLTADDFKVFEGKERKFSIDPPTEIAITWND